LHASSTRTHPSLIDQIASEHEGEHAHNPSFGITLFTVHLPVVLMLFAPWPR
jgi:hypothetical protein